MYRLRGGLAHTLHASGDRVLSADAIVGSCLARQAHLCHFDSALSRDGVIHHIVLKSVAHWLGYRLDCQDEDLGSDGSCGWGQPGAHRINTHYATW